MLRSEWPSTLVSLTLRRRPWHPWSAIDPMDCGPQSWSMSTIAHSDSATQTESVAASVESGCGTYWSRRRGLWKKGESSGNTQALLRIDLDCDRDTLRFTVRQTGAGFCHLDTHSCWGPLAGLPRLAETLAARRQSAPEGSYTKRLFDDPALLGAKLMEEAQELIEANSTEDAVWETADLVYFSLVAMTARGGRLQDVIETLNRRALGVSRRRGVWRNLVADSTLNIAADDFQRERSEPVDAQTMAQAAAIVDTYASVVPRVFGRPSHDSRAGWRPLDH